MKKIALLLITAGLATTLTACSSISEGVIAERGNNEEYCSYKISFKTTFGRDINRHTEASNPCRFEVGDKVSVQYRGVKPLHGSRIEAVMKGE